MRVFMYDATVGLHSELQSRCLQLFATQSANQYSMGEHALSKTPNKTPMCACQLRREYCTKLTQPLRIIRRRCP